MVVRWKWPFPPTPSSGNRGGYANRELEEALERNTAVPGKGSSETTVNERPVVQRQRPAATLLRRKTGSR